MSLKTFTAMAIVGSAAGLATMGASPLAFAMEAPPAFAMDSIPQLMQQERPGRFELHSGHMKTIADTTNAQNYRVCVGTPAQFDGMPAVPVTVESENGQQIVRPGDCAKVQSRILRLAPHGQLASDEVLIATKHKAG